MKNSSLLTVTLLILTMTFVPFMAGCSQAKINTVVNDIATWTPTLSSDAVALLADVATFDPGDAAAIQQAVTVINTDAPLLTAACKQYLAAPSASLLTQITGFVTTLATADSSAILALAQVKNPQSQATARGILTTIALGITIASGLLQTINQSAAVPATAQLRPYVNGNDLKPTLALMKSQDLVPQDFTLAQAGF
jgi:hypothetical protein